MKPEVFETVFGRPVSRETFQRLQGYADQVLKWQRNINLIAASTVATLWERHILDSSRLLHCVEGPDRWVDIGSGGGFPGMVIAILSGDINPACHFHLVESNGKKAAFLRESARLFAPNVTVHQARAEIFLSQHAAFDIVSARALAPLVDLTAWTQPLLIRGGLGLFMKGQEVQSETQVAKAAFPFRYAIHSGTSGLDGSVAAVWDREESHPLMSNANHWKPV